MSRAPDLVLTPQQKLLVRQSFESVQEYANSLTKLFYGRLFQVEPAVRSLFTGSIEEQSKKLLDMLATAVESLDQFEELRPKLEELGRKHVTYGAKAEHYDVVRLALLWTLGQALGLEFDQETRTAWDKMLRAISTAMLDGAAAAGEFDVLHGIGAQLHVQFDLVAEIDQLQFGIEEVAIVEFLIECSGLVVVRNLLQDETKMVMIPGGQAFGIVCKEKHTTDTDTFWHHCTPITTPTP